MNIQLNDTPYFDVITHNPSSGSTSDADSVPTYEVFEEGTDVAIASGSFTKRNSKTGQYRCSISCTVANGFEIGKYYSLIGSATVSGVTAKIVVAHFKIDPIFYTTATVQSGSNTTSIITDLTETTNNHYKGFVYFVTGDLIGQSSAISAYDGSTKTLTVDTLTDTPSDGDKILVLGG